MADADCCFLCCCCCSLLSLCNTTSTYPGYLCWLPRCCKIRRSKFDDDKFIDEVLRDSERHQTAVTETPAYESEVGYHITQPEPVAQMDMRYPPKQPPFPRPQQSTDPHQQQPEQKAARRSGEERTQVREGN